MSKTLLQQQFPISQELKQITKALIKSGDEIRLVGGCVRDFLSQYVIKSGKSKELPDIDIACKYSPDQTMELLKKARIKAIPTGIEHGTVTAVINSKKFEITSLREDIKCDGRHAVVKFGKDFKKDAERRDFTINAMSIDFDNNLYDYFGGIEDLKSNTIRFIGSPEQRIQEDYLRILRFFRFYCKYGQENSINKEGLEACIKYKKYIKELSGERISNEMFIILKQDNPLKTVTIMQDSNILPEAMAIEDAVKFDLDSLNHLLKIEKEWELNIDVNLRLASILIEKEEDIANTVLKRWRLPKKTRDYIIFLINKNPRVYLDIRESEIKQLLLDYPKKLIVDRLILNIVLDGSLIINDKTRQKFLKIVDFIKNYHIPIMPLTGEDLIREGLEEGAVIGELLTIGKQYWIKSDYKAPKEEIMDYILQQVKTNYPK